MPHTPDTPGPSLSRGGRHYPGREKLDAANAAFRRTVAKVFHDPDPNICAQTADLVAQAVAALDAATSKANRLLESSPRHQRALKRMNGQLARLAPRRPENGPHGDDAA